MGKLKKLLIVLVAAALYFNIGYFLGAVVYKIEVKYLQGQTLNPVERFLYLPGLLDLPGLLEGPECVRKSRAEADFCPKTACIVFYSMFWPVLLLFSTGIWTIWILFRLIFFGGLVKLFSIFSTF